MTSNEDLAEKLNRIFQEEVQIELAAIDGSTTLGELDIPSVDMVMVLYRIEEDLNAVIDPTENGPDTTVDQLKQQILLKSQAAG